MVQIIHEIKKISQTILILQHPILVMIQTHVIRHMVTVMWWITSSSAHVSEVMNWTLTAAHVMMWMNVAPDRQRVLSYVLTQLEDTHVAVMMDTGSLSTNTTVTVCIMCIPISCSVESHQSINIAFRIRSACFTLQPNKILFKMYFGVFTNFWLNLKFCSWFELFI